MIHFLTYADDAYQHARERIKKEAEYFGKFDTITVLKRQDLDPEFINRHSRIFSESFGGGYYIWKPYVVKQKLDKISEGDFLVYCDAGSCVNKNGIVRFNEYLNILQDFEILCFQLDYNTFGSESKWTKCEIFEHFKTKIEHRMSSQVCATIFVLKKGKHSTNFVNNWYNILEEDDTLFDNKSRITQTKVFVETRWDQSIFSMLSKTSEGVKILKDETYPPRKSRKNPFIATRSNKKHGHNSKYQLEKGIHIP